MRLCLLRRRFAGWMKPALVPFCALATAIRPAQRGATALVPPMTMFWPSTRIAYPVEGSASPETSGTPRPPPDVVGLGTLALACQVGRGEDVADAAAGCAFVVGELVPDDLGGDGGAAALEPGSTAGEDVGAGGGEVDVVGAVGGTVGGAVVSGGDGDGDAEGGGGLAGGIECGHGLAGPAGFGAPQLMEMTLGLFLVSWTGGGDGVDETLVGVGGEVDDDVGAGCDGGCDFDVEHDFAVGAVGVAGAVLCLPSTKTAVTVGVFWPRDLK